MNGSIVYLQPAFVLQQKKYGETSLIINFLTKDFGIVSILAKGVRKKKSKTAGLLLAFTSLKISYTGKNDLKVLTQVELDSFAVNLKGFSLYCGFYVNELVSYLIHKDDPHPSVFSIYFRCLLLLEHAENFEKTLRFFELDLLKHIGYGLQLNYEVSSGVAVKPLSTYFFSGESGILESSDGYISGVTLLALDAREELEKTALYEAKQLMRHVINFQLQGKVLKSRAVLAQIIKQL